MGLFIEGGRVVTGDETTVIERGTVVVDEDRITGVEARVDGSADGGRTRIDATGCLVLPGLVNAHTHGVAPGPLMPSAGAAPAFWRDNLDRHLRAGTTTVLSLCGFVSMEQIRAADAAHPVNVRAATAHLPSALAAARAADGEGLADDVEAVTVEAMLDAGAIAIGELGAGTTLGGGGQDVIHIPNAIETATGRRVDSHDARAIKEAALGRHVRRDAYDEQAMTAALEAAGLAGDLSPQAARQLVERCVLPSLEPALASFREGAAASARLGVPALLHVAAATLETTRDTAREFVPHGARLIACHCNHASFTPWEAVDLTVELAERGCTIELSTIDLLRERVLVRTREHWDALLAVPGLVDVLATDYGLDGVHDPLVAAAEDAYRHGYATLAESVAMVTSRPAAAIPGLAPQRALLARGRVADVAVVAENDWADVRHVVVGGRHVVADGALLEAVAT